MRISIKKNRGSHSKGVVPLINFFLPWVPGYSVNLLLNNVLEFKFMKLFKNALLPFFLSFSFITVSHILHIGFKHILYPRLISVPLCPYCLSYK